MRRATIWLHRWTSLVLGLVLLVVTTSGAVLVYEPELSRALQREAWAAPGPVALSMVEALEIVEAHDPDFVVDVVNHAHGTYVAEHCESGRMVHVDPSNGAVLYDSAGDEGGGLAWALEVAANLHLCALSCEEYPGYQAYQAWLRGGCGLGVGGL